MDSLSTPLHEAVKAENFQDVKALILNEAEINAKDGNNETPIYYAVEKYSVSIVEFLLKNGADIEAKNNVSLRTPLYVASAMGHLGIVKMLLKKGAKIDVIDFLGFTPICIASGSGHNLTVEALLQYGADIQCQRSMFRNTPLHWAADYHYGNDKTLETLVRKGAKVDAKNANGNTPIHTATTFAKNYPYVLMLMRFGSSMNIRNQDGFTPIEYALKKNQFFNKYDAKLRNFKVISYNEME